MRFITITLIVHAPDPFTGAQKSTRDRFREVLDSACLLYTSPSPRDCS